MVTHWLARDVCGGFESADPKLRADPVDEYRELAMLAGAWEHGALKPAGAGGASGRADDAVGGDRGGGDPGGEPAAPACQRR